MNHTKKMTSCVFLRLKNQNFYVLIFGVCCFVVSRVGIKMLLSYNYIGDNLKCIDNNSMSSVRVGSTESSDAMSISSIGEGRELVFQFGMERDTVVFEGKDMESLRELAGAFIESKVVTIISVFPYIFLCI